MIEVTVAQLGVDRATNSPVVILRERDGARVLPIWIGPAEASAIAMELQGVKFQRPLTHDLLNNVITSLGARVESVVVNDLSNDTFFARIILDVNGQSMEIDSRPSDALALAVRVKVPIFADEAVLDKAGVLLDQEEPAATPGEGRSRVNEEELERMSAFRDFIESLDLDDFDKRSRS